MAGSGPEFGKGEGNVEYNDEDPQQGGGGAMGVQLFFLSRCSVGTYFWRGDMGDYPTHGPGPGGVSGPGGATINRAVTAEAGRQETGIHLDSGGKGVGEI